VPTDRLQVGCVAVRTEKVIVLRELQRAIIYTAKMSKHSTKSHVGDAVHMYLVN
jgi:hypothetical protein